MYLFSKMNSSNLSNIQSEVCKYTVMIIPTEPDKEMITNALNMNYLYLSKATNSNKGISEI